MFKAEDHLPPASAKQKGGGEEGGHRAGTQRVSKVAFVSPACQAMSQPQDTSWAWPDAGDTAPPSRARQHPCRTRPNALSRSKHRQTSNFTLSTAHWKQNPRGLLHPEPGTCFSSLSATPECWHRGRTSSTNVFREVGAAGSNSAGISIRDLLHSKTSMLKAAAGRPFHWNRTAKTLREWGGPGMGLGKA